MEEDGLDEFRDLIVIIPPLMIAHTAAILDGLKVVLSSTKAKVPDGATEFRFLSKESMTWLLSTMYKRCPKNTPSQSAVREETVALSSYQGCLAHIILIQHCDKEAWKIATKRMNVMNRFFSRDPHYRTIQVFLDGASEDIKKALGQI